MSELRNLDEATVRAFGGEWIRFAKVLEAVEGGLSFADASAAASQAAGGRRGGRRGRA